MLPHLARRRGILCLLSAMLLVGACTSDSAEQQEGPTSGAYVAVVQWFVENSATPLDRPIVFLEARGEGLGIGLETQAAVVAGADDFAEVRFIDDRLEAFDDEGVRDDGIFIALGPVIEDGVRFNVECDQIFTEDQSTAWLFTLRFREGAWQLAGVPAELG